MTTEIHRDGTASVIITYMNEGDWGSREHLPSQDCWCKPYQDDEEPDVWIHNDPWAELEGKPKQ
jgi:hypothetical protein